MEEKLLDALVGPSNIQHNRDAFRKLLRMGHLDDRLIEIEVPEKKPGQGGPMEGGGNQFPMNEIILRFDKMVSNGRPKTEKREMLLKDCVPILTELESEKLINEDDIKKQALHLVEQVRSLKPPRNPSPLAGLLWPFWASLPPAAFLTFSDLRCALGRLVAAGGDRLPRRGR